MIYCGDLMSLDLGNIRLRHQLELRIQNKTYWFFHGDVFDASVLISPFLASLGGKGYDWLIRINAFINRLEGKYWVMLRSHLHTG